MSRPVAFHHAPLADLRSSRLLQRTLTLFTVASQSSQAVPEIQGNMAADRKRVQFLQFHASNASLRNSTASLESRADLGRALLGSENCDSEVLLPNVAKTRARTPGKLV